MWTKIMEQGISGIILKSLLPVTYLVYAGNNKGYAEKTCESNTRYE